MAEQNERAYQKQPTVFQNSKFSIHGIGKKTNKLNRYVKNIGLGFKTPREVIFLLVYFYFLIKIFFK